MNIRVKGKDAAAKVLQVLKDAGGHDRDVLAVRKQLEDIVSRPANTAAFLDGNELQALAIVAEWIDTAPLPSNYDALREAAAVVAGLQLRLRLLAEKRIAAEVEEGRQQRGRGRR